MTLRLFVLDTYPKRIAISDVASYVEDGAFFLDFTRPLEHMRRLGLTVGIFIPVVHQGEENGGYVVGISRGDHGFAEIRKLWRTHYPSNSVSPSSPANGLKIIVDFAAQFPNHCKLPKT